MTDQPKTADFQRGVEAMRRAAVNVCRAEMRHGGSHAGDPRYVGRKDGAEACAVEIQHLDVSDE